MKSIILSLLTCLLIPTVSNGQTAKPYSAIASERAVKIVTPLKISNQAKAEKVTKLIAGQYTALDQLQGNQENQLKEKNANSALIKATTQRKISELHESFLSKLKTELSPDQIDEVKNGMTYHTLPLTYANYLLMLPYLKTDEKQQIHSLLIQAREQAMDAGSSKGKHAVFNNFKGKIANYLSSKGYELKGEGDAWAKRRDQAAQRLEITESKRIIETLSIADPQKKETLRNLIAYQYQQIAKIHDAKSSRAEAIKKTQSTPAEIEKDNQAGWEESKAKLDAQRDAFTLALNEQLTRPQVEQIKNEMTAQGAQKEYAKFLELLPELKEEHKLKVLEYLIEARENAISVLSSRERNQWFAKYRGRANNYLSKQGYDLRKATEELERKNAQKP